MGQKHKKNKDTKKKSHKKESHKKKSRYSSSSSSTSSEEWVEKETVKSTPSASNSRDEWMMMDTCFAGKTKKELHEEKQKESEKTNVKERMNILDAPGQSVRELNPYWKHGGTGLPSAINDTNPPISKVGDKGAHWLRKALERGQETAAETGRSLEDVMSERWGSLNEFYRILKEAEKKEDSKSGLHSEKQSRRYENKKYDLSYKPDRNSKESKFRKPDSDNEDRYRDSRDKIDSKNRKPDSDHDNHRYDRNRQDSKFRKEDDDDDKYVKNRRDARFRKHSDDYHTSERNRNSSKFRKPDDDDYKYDKNRSDSKPVKSDNYKYSRESESRSRSNKKNWKKPSFESNETNVKVSKDELEERMSPVEENKSHIMEEKKDDSIITIYDDKILSINELNHLFADAFRADLAGKKELSEKLGREAKLQKERRISALENKEIRDTNADKVVILTETDNRGFTRPVKSLEGSTSKKRKVNTHEGQNRVRYFADDDKYSLQDLFEKEKYNTSNDDQDTFLKLLMQNKKNDLDDEGAFDKARMDESGKDDHRKRARLIKDHKNQEQALDNCRWCLGSKAMMDECVVISKTNVFVAAPTTQSLTDRHCLFIPHAHTASATLLDENVWEEIMDLRKTVVKKLEEDDEDVIFFEIACNFHKHPHMVLHCVPVPREIGDTAPIYFKKAILDSEREWSDNKKVVDLAGRDVRKAVPKGLPYFFVDFGMQSGYAHVIEDKRYFSTNFGQEIIGGMLDLDHTIWRKPRRDTDENIEKKVKLIKQLFEE